MKTSIPWLWQHRQYLSTKTLFGLCIMSGISSLKSKISYLSTIAVEKARGKQVSVVYYDPDSGVIDWPEFPNQNSGVLVVPQAHTIEQWIERYGDG